MKQASSENPARASILDIDFLDSWKALGTVACEAPVTVIIKDGDTEIARGRAETPMGPGRYSFMFDIPEPQNDRLQGFVAETGMEIPRRVDWDD